MKSLKSILTLAVVALLGASTVSQAVIVYGKSTRNKDAPGGIVNSGWEFEGSFGGFSAWPVGNKYFISAAHIGGNVSTPLVYQGKTYTSTAMWDDPNSDLRLYKVKQKFTSWAPLYTDTAEVGQTMLVMGRGTTRSAEIRDTNGQLKGWRWGKQDAALSWGVNQVDTIYNGGSGFGQFLQFDFDSDQGKNEGILSRGDSGGGVFVKQNKKWRLAGVNYSVDGPFSTTNGGATFMGALFDTGGLYKSNQLVSDQSINLPVSAYATRVGSNLSWVNNVLSGAIAPTSTASAAIPSSARGISPVPEPVGATLVLVGSGLLLRRHRVRR